MIGISNSMAVNANSAVKRFSSGSFAAAANASIDLLLANLADQ